MNFLTSLFGKVATDTGYITPGQLEEAVRYQSENESFLHLGEVLIGQGAINRLQCDEILAIQAWRRICGDGTPSADDLVAILAVRWHFSSLADIYLCVAQCRAMSEVGVELSVADQLVRRGLLTTEKREGIAQLLDSGGWPCPACGVRADLAVYAIAKQTTCRRCDAALGPDADTDTEVAALAGNVLEQGILEPPKAMGSPDDPAVPATDADTDAAAPGSAVRADVPVPEPIRIPGSNSVPQPAGSAAVGLAVALALLAVAVVAGVLLLVFVLG